MFSLMRMTPWLTIAPEGYITAEQNSGSTIKRKGASKGREGDQYRVTKRVHTRNMTLADRIKVILSILVSKVVNAQLDGLRRP